MILTFFEVMVVHLNFETCQEKLPNCMVLKCMHTLAVIGILMLKLKW